MAEIDPQAIVDALRKKAQDKIRTQRLNNPEFEKDQLRVDQANQEDNTILGGLKAPGRDEQLEIGRSVMKKLDDSVRIAGNPFGVGDALEAGMSNRTLEESRAATEAARQRLGPNMSKVLEVGGELGASIATAPFSLTVKGAAIAGGVQNLVTDAADKWFKEDRLPTLTEAVTATGLGAGLSGLGQLFGSRLARWMVDKGAAKTPLAQGADLAVKNSTKQMARAMQFADESDAIVPKSTLMGFITKTLGNPKFQEQGLDPNIDRGLWDGFNTLKARVFRLEPGQGLTIRELSDARSMMRDRAARGASRSDAMFDIDRAFEKAIHVALVGNPKGRKAWEMISKHELPRMQGEFLANLSDKAELASSAGQGPIDKMLQRQFQWLVTEPAGRKLMVKLGFTPEQKDLFREAAHGTTTTVLANKLDRVTGNTLIAPIYRTTIQPLLRARGTATETGNVMKILGKTFDQPASSMVPPLNNAMSQLTNPLAAQITPPVQQAAGISPNPSAGQVQPSQATPSAPAPNTGPQRMPRPLTPQSQSAVPKLPNP